MRNEYKDPPNEDNFVNEKVIELDITMLNLKQQLKEMLLTFKSGKS